MGLPNFIEIPWIKSEGGAGRFGTKRVKVRLDRGKGGSSNIEIDPETYAVRADGELLVCEPAKVLPMAQRYFLF